MKPAKVFAGISLSLASALALAQEVHAPWFAKAPPAVVESGRLPSTIRVRLVATRSSVKVGCTGDYAYVALRSRRAKPVSVSKGTVLKVRGASGGMVIQHRSVTGSVLVSPRETGKFMTLDGRPFRGALILRPRSHGGLDVIDQVGLEDYLYGVLPQEVGADWPQEALKAQALVSRTFVMANLGKYMAKGYDLTSDVFSQAYGGQSGEHPATTQAVQATAGEILVDRQGVPIQAYFHSSCGGYTEDPRYVWRTGGDPPEYLASIRDSYCKDDPYYHWQLQISGDLLRKRVLKAGYGIGKVRGVKIASYAPSGRAWIMAVESTWGRFKIPANNFRIALGPDVLRSVFITDIRQRGKYFIFEGRGWGHGVGMCQWGARGRALDGQSYEKILAAYFPHTRLVRWKYDE